MVKFKVSRTMELPSEGENYYNQDINIKSNNNVKEIYINGNKIDGKNIKLTDEGTYDLKIVNADGTVKLIKIIIDKTMPQVTGVVDTKSYNKPVKITFNEGRAVFDGKVIANKTICYAEGKHTLVVSDKAGNTNTIHFTIDTTAPKIMGAKEAQVYDEEVTITYDHGIGLVNGKEFNSGATFENGGSYNIQIADEAGNKTKVSFNITECTLEKALEKIKQSPAKLKYYKIAEKRMREKNYRGIKVFADGKQVDFTKYNNVQPFEVKKAENSEKTEIMIPLRAVAETLKYKVDWDNTTRTVTVNAGSNVIKINIDSNEALCGNTTVNMNAPFKIVNGRTIVPESFLGEAFSREKNLVDYSDSLKVLALFK